MRNNNEILHRDETTREENFYTVDLCDLFAVVITSCLKQRLTLQSSIIKTYIFHSV